MADKGTVSWDSVELAPIIFIHASEAVFADRAQARLHAMARDKDPNVERVIVDAAHYQTGELAQMVSPSLFGDAKIIDVPDMENMTDALLADLLAYADNPEPGTVMILRRNKGVRGKRLVDKLKKIGAPIVECPDLKWPRDKAAFVKNDVRNARRRIEEAAVDALVKAMPDTSELAAAVTQLISDTTGTITVKMVSDYYGGRVDASGFQVADAAVAGNKGHALSLARHAYETGADPVVIVSAMAIKLRQMALAAGASSRGGAAGIGLSPWQLKNAQKELRSWSEAGLAAAISAVADADAQVKGESRDPEYAVERAIIAICDARQMRSRY